nr:unknown protein [synthetic construct]
MGHHHHHHHHHHSSGHIDDDDKHMLELILVLLGTLSLGIAILALPKYQTYSLGFCIGFISIVQPSNHMDFEVAKSITIGMSTIVGSIGLWLAFKLYPQSPYTISRKIAIKSIVKDIQKLKRQEISKEHYQAGLIKKILSVYRNRKDDPSSEKDIEFALQSLLQTMYPYDVPDYA